MSLKDDLEGNFEQLVETLEKQRDQIKLKIHLGSMEARQEWEHLENKLQQLKIRQDDIKDKADHIGEEVGAAGKKIKEATKDLGKEIKAGYERLRELL